MSKEVIEIDDEDFDSLKEVTLVQRSKRKIIFCIDVSIEVTESLKPSANGGVKDTNLYISTRLETVKRFLKRYIHINIMLGNLTDEYAIVLLKNGSEWGSNFTSLPETLNKKLDSIDEEIGNYGQLDMQHLFDTLNQKINLKDSNYFFQTIVIYSRDSVPKPTKNNQYLSIRNSKNFTLDIVYLHGMSDSVQTIYDFWNDYDSSVNRGWYYETGVFQGKDNMAKALSQLIAHPLQRGDQERIEDVV